MDLKTKIIKLAEFNESPFEELILLIYINYSVGQAAFRPVRNVKSLKFLKGNGKVV